MPFGFSDKQKKFDFGSTNYDFGARFYEARIGRWMSVDPMKDKREWRTPYNYVQNSPILRIDPTGAVDNTYEVTNGIARKIDDKGGD